MPTAQPVEPLAFNSQTPSTTSVPSETIQWFPPTNTPTQPLTRTVQPTINQRPGVGSLLISDNFISPDTWPTLQGETGNIAIGNAQLSLAISSPRGYLSSINDQILLKDFYLEITAAPSLCRELDTYGLILRAADAQNYYRFAISCSGLTRLEWVQNGSMIVLREWEPSGQVPIGAPASLHVGIWAYRDEMRIFIDDNLQITATQLQLETGRFGVFARSEGSSALSVSFSDLSVYGLGMISPSSTPSLPSQSATP